MIANSQYGLPKNRCCLTDPFHDTVISIVDGGMLWASYIWISVSLLTVFPYVILVDKPMGCRLDEATCQIAGSRLADEFNSGSACQQRI